jgi:hypothetical protein
MTEKPQTLEEKERSIMAKRSKGSVYQSNGRWVGSLSLPDGTRLVFYGKKQSEVVAKLDEAMKETRHIGMDQLAYFVNMVDSYLDIDLPDRRARFWDRIREDCPELMQAIDAQFAPEGLREITFTWSRTSPAFDPHLVSEDGQPEQREQLPDIIEHRERTK